MCVKLIASIFFFFLLKGFSNRGRGFDDERVINSGFGVD
jgi:hypothetical protein